MITGFNTDVNYDGVTYHVQTEDKGLDTPLILSLVYQHGTILASKRSSYDDLLEAGFDETVLEERLKRQHKLMCAAVHIGRIEDLKQMTRRNAKKVEDEDPDPLPIEKPDTASLEAALAKPDIEVEPVAEVSEVAGGQAEAPVHQESPAAEVPLPSLLRQDKLSVELTEIPVEPEPEPGEDSTVETVWDIPMIEDVEIIESDEGFFDEGFVLSPDAISIVDDLQGADIAVEEELKIKFLADYTFRSGEKKNVNLIVCRGDKEKEVENASIMVKVLGSAFRPIIFHSKTDKHGVATVFVRLPEFKSGRAAILIRASTGGEETELRKVILHSD